MAISEDTNCDLAALAGSAGLWRDLFIAREALIAEILDRPFASSAPRGSGGYKTQERALVSMERDLTPATGLATALGAEWFPCESWGAWAAAKRAPLFLTLGDDVALPTTLRLELCALIVGDRARHAKLWSPIRQIGVAGFVRSDVGVAVTIEIAEADLSLDRRVDLIVEVDDLVSPRAASGAADERMLGVGIACISIERAPIGAPPPAKVATEPETETAPRLKRFANLLRRVRGQLKEKGLARGSVYLARAALRRLLLALASRSKFVFSLLQLAYRAKLRIIGSKA